MSWPDHSDARRAKSETRGARAWRRKPAFEQRCQEEGAKILAEATAKNEKMILAGRPALQQLRRRRPNLGLPQKIADMGRTVFAHRLS